MKLIYKFLSSFCKLLLNLLFLIQLALMILIFLTAAYWFFDLINSSLFAFAEPVASAISNFVKSLYSHDISMDGVYIDGSLLLFDIVAAVLVVVLAKFKYYLFKLTEILDYAVIVCNKKDEKKLNEDLKRDAERIIKQYKQAAIVFEFDAKNMQVDSLWGSDKSTGVQSKIDEALKIFYATIKSISGCTFAKTDNKLAIMVSDFEKIDNVLIYLEQALKRIKDNMQKQNWELIVYCACDAFYDNTDFRNAVYPNIEKLLNLKFKNEIICYGNFVLRYDMKSAAMYYLILQKGDYKLSESGEVCNIYSLVKKN